jgi:hypothetical protein
MAVGGDGGGGVDTPPHCGTPRIICHDHIAMMAASTLHNQSFCWSAMCSSSFDIKLDAYWVER